MRPVKFAACILLLLLLGLACSHGSPTAPAETDTAALHQVPRMMPLAPGASWQYSLYYYYEYQANSAGPLGTDKDYGRIEFEVLHETDTNGAQEYELRVILKLDSLYHQFNLENGYMHPGDTTYTQDSDYDTTYYRTIVYARDTLWYKAADSLYMMLADSAFSDSRVNLELFNTARYDFFDRSIAIRPASSLPSQTVYKGEWPLWWGVSSLTAFIKPAEGGISKVVWFAAEGDIAHYSKEIQFNLIEYTPGQTGEP